MSLSRSSSKYSRHDKLTSSQLMDAKKTQTPKLFQLGKKSESQQFFISLNNRNLNRVMSHDALKAKIKEKRFNQIQDTETLLSKFVQKIDPLKKLSIDTQAPPRTTILSLTPQTRQASRLVSPKVKPRSQSQIKRESYYLMNVKQAFNSNGSDYFSRLHREHFHQTYQALNFKFTARESSDYNRVIRLPKSQEYKNKITLFFDLDETLVHCNESPTLPCDLLLDIQVSKFQQVKAGINNLSSTFELIIFTASHSCYAEKVINYLDPDGKYIAHRLFREHCTMTNNNLYTKDLKIFCDNHTRPLNKVAIIDNAAYSYAWNVSNGIPIIPFYDSKDDRVLYDLEAYLMNMDQQEDVREYNKLNLKLHQFQEPKGPYYVLDTLFGKICTQKIEITPTDEVVLLKKTNRIDLPDDVTECKVRLPKECMNLLKTIQKHSRYPPQLLSNGDIYEGQWTAGQKNGKGVLLRTNQVIQYGQWNFDQFIPGVIIYPNGDRKIGDKYIYANGIILICSDNFGKEVHPDGTTYEGDFQKQMRHGKGKITYSDGTFYEGEFYENKFQGYGKFQFKNSYYEGQWHMNQMHGHGEFHWNSDTKYIGQYRFGYRHGEGHMFYSDHSEYKGPFYMGKKHGKGKVTKDGIPKEKTYDMGKLVVDVL